MEGNKFISEAASRLANAVKVVSSNDPRRVIKKAISVEFSIP